MEPTRGGIVSYGRIFLDSKDPKARPGTSASDLRLLPPFRQHHALVFACPVACQGCSSGFAGDCKPADSPAGCPVHPRFYDRPAPAFRPSLPPDAVGQAHSHRPPRFLRKHPTPIDKEVKNISIHQRRAAANKQQGRAVPIFFRPITHQHLYLASSPATPHPRLRYPPAFIVSSDGHNRLAIKPTDRRAHAVMA